MLDNTYKIIISFQKMLQQNFIFFLYDKREWLSDIHIKLQ